ncbi:MAG: tetratricopeptide repeat protein, partial [Bryobacteraceae bacterium]
VIYAGGTNNSLASLICLENNSITNCSASSLVAGDIYTIAGGGTNVSDASSTGNGAMVALVLNSVGEIHERQGRPQQAEQCFEAALEPACDGPHPPVPVMYMTVAKLADSRFNQSRYDEAEPLYATAEKLATLQRDPRAKLQAIEKMGLCQWMQAKKDKAVKSWRVGAEIAGKLEIPELQGSMLMRLREHYAAADLWIEQQEVENQLAVLKMG